MTHDKMSRPAACPNNLCVCSTKSEFAVHRRLSQGVLILRAHDDYHQKNA